MTGHGRGVGVALALAAVAVLLAAATTTPDARASTPAASPAASPSSAGPGTGDVRTTPAAPGLVGDPLFAVAGVLVVAAVAVGGTLVAIRFGDRDQGQPRAGGPPAGSPPT